MHFEKVVSTGLRNCCQLVGKVFPIELDNDTVGGQINVIMCKKYLEKKPNIIHR